MKRDLIIVIAKDKQEGYARAKEAGYHPAFTIVVDDAEKAEKIAKRFGTEILNEQD